MPLEIVAIAYVMQKTPYVFPIIGSRRLEQFKQNLEALEITLNEEQVKYLESVLPFDLGFPSNIIVSSYWPCVNYASKNISNKCVNA